MMDLQLWTTSRLARLTPSLRREVTFYAPLLESLDFMGIEPVTFARASTATRLGRDGLEHTVAANVPVFTFSPTVPEQALGCLIATGASLQYSNANALD